MIFQRRQTFLRLLYMHTEVHTLSHQIVRSCRSVCLEAGNLIFPVVDVPIQEAKGLWIGVTVLSFHSFEVDRRPV